MAMAKAQKQVTRILVRRDDEGNDVAITYYVTKFADIWQAKDFFGEERMTMLLQQIHERDEKQNAIRNSELATKVVKQLMTL